MSTGTGITAMTIVVMAPVETEDMAMAPVATEGLAMALVETEGMAMALVETEGTAMALVATEGMAMALVELEAEGTAEMATAVLLGLALLVCPTEATAARKCSLEAR